MGNSNLIFAVGSTEFDEPQFQFILDIYESGSATLVQRIKQQPNPSGGGFFDIGNIIPTLLESDNVWTASPFATSSESNKDFIIKFGEEYGTSTSSSVTVYDGLGGAGEPNKTGSAFYTITDGLTNDENEADWNFASSSYYTPQTASSDEAFTEQVALSSFPVTQSVQEGEYQTISVYNGNVDDGEILAQDIFYYQVSFYNSAGSQIQNNDFINKISNGGGPRTNDGDEWTDVYTEQTNKTRLLHVGVGPQNLEDAGISIPATWAYYDVTLRAQSDDLQEDGDTQWIAFRFEKDTANCGYPGKRFAWKNEFGVWDYFTFKLAESTNDRIERNSFDKSFVDYSSTTAVMPYDQQRRGRTQYYNKVNKQHTVESDYLTQEYADSLRELFYSTNVYVQEGTTFEPVVITNANITEKTNPRTQKLFRYTANYEYANEVRPRR
jgi:hypothetical protein